MSKNIVAAVGDMIFAAKINGAAEHHNVAVTFVRSIEKLLAEAREKAPVMILLDLNTTRFDAVAAIEQLKHDEALKTITIVSFLSHVQVELRERALQAGADRVLARSQFSANLGAIISGSF